MRVMGLDYGSKRIGIALSDETAVIAAPHLSLATSGSLQKDIAELGSIAREYEVETIVIGLPKSLSGEPRGDSAARVLAFGAKIEQVLGIKVEYWDERFTTAEAERVLKSANVKRAARRKAVDKMAASLILQSYLNARATID